MKRILIFNYHLLNHRETHSTCRYDLYQSILQPYSPGLSPSLSFYWPQPFPDDWQFGCVNHFGFSAAIGELQRSVPLPLSLAHNGVGGVVFDLCSHPGQHTNTVDSGLIILHCCCKAQRCHWTWRDSLTLNLFFGKMMDTSHKTGQLEIGTIICAEWSCIWAYVPWNVNGKQRHTHTWTLTYKENN